MRLVTAWARVALENVSLKLATVCLCLCVFVLAFACAKISLKPPLVIERACYTQARSQAKPKPTHNEIYAFLQKTLEMRFSSDSIVMEGYLSEDERKFKALEQAELKSKKMKQRVILTDMKIKENQIEVDSDRIISVGKVRSAFYFPLQISLATTTRTASNPYGLVLTRVSKLSEKVKQ